MHKCKYNKKNNNNKLEYYNFYFKKIYTILLQFNDFIIRYIKIFINLQ